MLTYLDNESNVFADVDSTFIFDNMNPFDPRTFSAYTKFSEGIQTVSDRALGPLDTSSDSSSSQSVSTPEVSEDSDSNHSISESSSIFTPHLVDTSITGNRRRSWRSFLRTLPANAKHVRLAPPSRNKQASQAISQVISRVLNTNHVEMINFICPECGWKQISKRVPDFKRHIKTHLRPKDDDHFSGYWCKGVRVEDARQYAIQPNAMPYKFQEHERIGGCMCTFSRRDALKRHLDNANISCVREMLN